MNGMNERPISLELLNYYDSKIKTWTMGSILNNVSSLSAKDIIDDFYIFELDDGEYKSNTAIKCYFDNDNSVTFDGVISTINITSDNDYKYYVLHDTKSNGNVVFYYGFTDKTTGMGQYSTFSFQDILADILQLKNDVVISSGSITSEKLADDSITETKIVDKSVTANKLSDDAKLLFDTKGAANTALESAKTYTDNAFSWGKF